MSVGLRNDPIQPLVIRANVGDCVEVNFTNGATGGEYGISIDGLAFATESSGDAVGKNCSSATANGETRTYRFWIPRRQDDGGRATTSAPAPGNAPAIAHGLFGALVAEPAGSKYLHPDDGQPIRLGLGGHDRPRHRPEGVPRVHVRSCTRSATRPRRSSTRGTASRCRRSTRPPRPTAPARARINYRSEPFMRPPAQGAPRSRTRTPRTPSAIPATPMPRGYLGDPTKFRVVHGGSEMFHVYHLHGGGIRWRANPHADKTFDYQRHRPATSTRRETSTSSRLDSQATGPARATTSRSRAAPAASSRPRATSCCTATSPSTTSPACGPSGACSTRCSPTSRRCPTAPRRRRPSTRPAADRPHDARRHDDHQGQPRRVDPARSCRRRACRTTPRTPRCGTGRSTPPTRAARLPGRARGPSGWPDNKTSYPAHPGRTPGDEFVGERPKILFDPTNGRPAFPLLRPHIGQRPPFSPNGHSGAPWLGRAGRGAAGRARQRGPVREPRRRRSARTGRDGEDVQRRRHRGRGPATRRRRHRHQRQDLRPGEDKDAVAQRRQAARAAGHPRQRRATASRSR